MFYIDERASGAGIHINTSADLPVVEAKGRTVDELLAHLHTAYTMIIEERQV